MNIQEPTFSFKLNELRNLFKLFQNDVGLLTSQYASGIQLHLLQGEVKQNYGAIYENLVAQELYCHGFGGDEHELHYFNSKKQGELDFAYVLTNDNLRVEGKRIYMPMYMLMFIQKSPAPANQIFKFDLHNL